jgi:hypothetical protein
MIKEKLSKNITDIFSSEKEVPILKNFPPNSPLSTMNSAFLYSDPPEIILQSKSPYIYILKKILYY